MDMQTETLYTLEFAAKLLKVHQRTIKRWAESGLVELVLLPSGQHRIAGSELSRITQGKVQVQPESEEA